MFSRSVEYAIRAMTFLATQPTGRLTGAREISQAEKIPAPFLWKILQGLARQRLIRSFRGVRGGYELARPASEITLENIIQAIDTTEAVESCVLGLPQCSEENPCPMHPVWKDLKLELSEMLRNNTLADLARVAQQRAATGK